MDLDSLWEQGANRVEVLSVSGDTCKMRRTDSLWIAFGAQLEDTMVTVYSLLCIVCEDSVSIIAGDSLVMNYLDLPLEKGKTWGDWIVTDMDAEVETPAGTFTGCAEVYTESDIYGDLYYYCPDTG